MVANKPRLGISAFFLVQHSLPKSHVTLLASSSPARFDFDALSFPNFFGRAKKLGRREPEMKTCRQCLQKKVANRKTASPSI